ncbi:MAG: hypothetical protein R3F59_17345 [Myxococcota bacterium]
MDRVHQIRRGLDIPIAGGASGEIVALPLPASVAYLPRELRGMTVRPAVREGDRVAQGAVLLADKADRAMVLRAPTAGVVREIRRGARRVITDVIVDVEPEGPVEALRAFDLAALQALDRPAAVEAVLASGWWPALRTRPLDQVARPDTVPQSILVGALETGPLMPGAAQLLDPADREALQAAIYALGKLAPRVILAAGEGGHPALSGLQGIELHTFAGPHPAGDPAVQVNLVDPPRGTGQVWTIRAWDAVSLGRTLLGGRFAAERVIAAVGTGVVQPRFVRTVLGAPIRDVVGEVHPGEQRYILGSVLTGTAVTPDRWTAMGARAVHVLPEEVDRSLLGWALPMLGAWSFHSAFLKGLLNARPAGGIDLRPGRYGGVRAILPLGVYEKVIATPDIEPEFLFKALSAGDLEESLRLGLLDLSEEEAALCTYICPSKIQLDLLLRDGLEQYVKEAG